MANPTQTVKCGFPALTDEQFAEAEERENKRRKEYTAIKKQVRSEKPESAEQ